MNEEELTSESLQVAAESGLPFESADVQFGKASPVSPEEPSLRVARRRRKLGGSPIVMSSEAVQKIMEREMETRVSPGSCSIKVNQQGKNRALQRLKKLKTATPEMHASSLTSSPPSTPRGCLEVEMPSSSSLTDVAENDPTSSHTMLRVGNALLAKTTQIDKVQTAAVVSPQRRPNFTAFSSYEDLEESMIMDTWSQPPPHTYIRELAPHVSPPTPVIVTPERDSKLLRSKLTSLKKKQRGRWGRDDGERPRMSQEKKSSRVKDKVQEEQAMATPNSPPDTARSDTDSPNENLNNYYSASSPGSNQRMRGRSPNEGWQLRKSIAEDVLGRLAKVETQLEESLHI